MVLLLQPILFVISYINEIFAAILLASRTTLNVKPSLNGPTVHSSSFLINKTGKINQGTPMDLKPLPIALPNNQLFLFTQSIILICLYIVRKHKQRDIFLIHPHICLNKLLFGLNVLINGGQEHLSS